MNNPKKLVAILYTNYRGDTSLRRVLPKKVWFGGTDWHPEPQWLLDAEDVDRGVDRTFALKDIRAWLPADNVSER